MQQIIAEAAPAVYIQAPAPVVEVREVVREVVVPQIQTIEKIVQTPQVMVQEQIREVYVTVAQEVVRQVPYMLTHGGLARRRKSLSLSIPVC